MISAERARDLVALENDGHGDDQCQEYGVAPVVQRVGEPREACAPKDAPDHDCPARSGLSVVMRPQYDRPSTCRQDALTDRAAWLHSRHARRIGTIKTRLADDLRRHRRVAGILIGVVAVALAVGIATAFGFGLLRSVDSFLAQFVVVFVANSLSFYVFHRLLHTRLLWESHKVHHSAEDYNVLLPYRNHPLDHLGAVLFGAFFADRKHFNTDRPLLEMCLVVARWLGFRTDP